LSLKCLKNPHQKSVIFSLLLLFFVSWVDDNFDLASNFDIYYRKTIKKNSELTKMHAIKDKLFSIISYDLRSPISSLSENLKFANTQSIEKDKKTKILQNVTFGVDNA